MDRKQGEGQDKRPTMDETYSAELIYDLTQGSKRHGRKDRFICKDRAKRENQKKKHDIHIDTDRWKTRYDYNLQIRMPLFQRIKINV